MQQNEVLNYFSRYIEREVGIIYNSENLYQLEMRLNEALKVMEINSLFDLYKCIETQHPSFNKQLFIDLATNNETSFFRDPRIFQALESVFQKMIDELIQNKESLKIWSAATSTGQEPISITILLEELLSKSKMSLDYSLLCSDISQRVLNRAKEGLYSDLEVARGLSPAMLQKYFLPDHGNFKVHPQIMQHLKFLRHNLKNSHQHLGKFHFIFCRNVLIYQKVESKKEIIDRLTDSLYAGGYLVLGAGESLLGLSDQFQQEVVNGSVFYRKK